MIQGFFTILIAMCSIFIATYSFFYDKKNLFIILFLLLLSVFSVQYWQASILFLGFLLLSIHKKISFATFTAFSMFGAVLLAYFFLNLFLVVGTELMFYMALFSVISICALAIFGIFEDVLRKYLFISNTIQITFVVLDLSVAKMIGELSVLGTVQIFNYCFAGLALFLTLGVFGANKNKVSELKGSYFRNKWNDAFCTIACLSLAGLPAFNMFVSEWALFTGSFSASPIIAVLGIFAALLLFIMYYKVVYVLLVGEGVKKYAPQTVTILNGVLASCSIIFGVLPQIQWYILSKVIL